MSDTQAPVGVERLGLHKTFPRFTLGQRGPGVSVTVPGEIREKAQAALEAMLRIPRDAA